MNELNEKAVRLTKANALKLRIFEMLVDNAHSTYIENTLRTIASHASEDYDYDKAVEAYEVIKEWNSLIKEESQ